MNYDAKIDADHEGRGARSLFAPGDDDERLISRKMVLVGLAVVLLLVGLWFFNRMNQPADLSASGVSRLPAVTVLTPGRASVIGEINATGTLAARRELPIGVVGEGGRIERVLVEPGDWVAAGQVLAVIDRSVQNQQAAGLAAQIGVAQADARLAQGNLDRGLKLVERGFISKADIDRLTATRDAAAARVRVATAQLAETRARNNRLDIVAPAAGLVLERKVEPAQVVSPGSGVLFRLAKGGEMELRADLSENDLANVSIGASAEVIPVGTDRAFKGQIWQISPIIDPGNRQGTVRIALPYAAELRPGGFATVRLAGGALVAPKLPETAILADDKGSYVYIVDKDNKVARRDVVPGSIVGNTMIIKSGLTGSERVVLRAGAFLTPGETVNPKPTKSD